MANLSLRPAQFTRAVAGVFVGGAIGTLLRDLALKIDPVPVVSRACRGVAPLVSAGSPQSCPEGFAPVWWLRDVPWTLLVINAVGVYLVTRLLRTRLRGHEPNDLTRLFVVTGFFGGFTSYSTLFFDLAAIWHVNALGSLLTAAAAVASGVLSAGVGLGRRHSQ